MNSRLRLVLGGIGFDIHAPNGLDLVERDGLYGPFLADHRTTEIDIETILSIDPAPDVTSMLQLFDTDETWAAYIDNEDVVLRLRTEGPETNYLWQAHLENARVSGGLTKLQIYCGPRLLEQASEGPTVLANPLHYPLDQLVLMFCLPSHSGVLVHAAGISRNGRGLFLAGKSGAGKTTFMRQCQSRDDIEGLSDDRIIARLQEETLRLHGTPWAGEGRVAQAKTSAFSALTFLHQSSSNELRGISPLNAFQQLMPTASILWFDRLRMEQAMAFCEELVQNVPCYELHFRPEPAAIDLLDDLI